MLFFSSDLGFETMWHGVEMAEDGPVLFYVFNR